MTWTYFLLRNIEPGLLRKLKADAKREKRSLSDFIRSVMCDRYKLDCLPSEAESKLKHGAVTQVLRLQPELHAALKEDAAEHGQTMRSVLLEILESRYVTREEIA